MLETVLAIVLGFLANFGLIQDMPSHPHGYQAPALKSAPEEPQPAEAPNPPSGPTEEAGGYPVVTG